MDFEKIWHLVKKWLGPTFLLPLFLVIAFDYLRALLWWGQILLCAFIFMQTFATVGGFILGAIRQTSPESPWLKITDYNIVRVFPTIVLGEKVFKWVMSPKDNDD